jgi:hypothetical protein
VTRAVSIQSFHENILNVYQTNFLILTIYVLGTRYIACKLNLNLKSTLLSVFKSCRSEKSRSFGGTCRLHFQGRNIFQSRNQHTSARGKHSLLVQPEDEVICSTEMSPFIPTTRHKPEIILLIITAVRTSNPTTSISFQSRFLCHRLKDLQLLIWCLGALKNDLPGARCV